MGGSLSVTIIENNKDGSAAAPVQLSFDLRSPTSHLRVLPKGRSSFGRKYASSAFYHPVLLSRPWPLISPLGITPGALWGRAPYLMPKLAEGIEHIKFMLYSLLNFTGLSSVFCTSILHLCMLHT